MMRRRQCEKGIWLRLKHIHTGLQMWFGSAHWTQGCTQAQHAQEVFHTLQSLQATSLPTIFAADSNAAIGWCRGQGELLPHGLDGKGLRMLDSLKKRGLTVMGPSESQRDLPTSRPRKQGVKGTVIDHSAAARVRIEGMYICEDSFQVIGTDHDMVLGTAVLQGLEKVPPRFGTRPRQVVAHIPASKHVDQHTLKHWAETITKPMASQAYRDSAEVKQLFCQAKVAKTPESWKAAFKARQEARKQWEEQRLARATQGDWKALKATRQRQSTWESGFAEANQGEPHEAIHDHLAGIYEGEPIGPWNPNDEPMQEVPPFSLEELKLAVDKGKLGKALGPDGVPHELLVQVACHEVAGPQLLDWYNEILKTSVMPEDWSSRVMVVVLPKIPQPMLTKQLRPISLGSAVCKVFSRMLLNRSLPLIGEAGSRQCAGQGRQASDYLFATTRLMALEREWRFGLSFVRLDLPKAFPEANCIP